MTKEFYEDVLAMVRNMVPPPQTLAEATAEAAPVWKRLAQAVSDPEEQSVQLLVLSAQTMLAFFQQALMQELRDDIHFLRVKEQGTGLRVHLTPGPPLVVARSPAAPVAKVKTAMRKTR